MSSYRIGGLYVPHHKTNTQASAQTQVIVRLRDVGVMETLINDVVIFSDSDVEAAEAEMEIIERFSSEHKISHQAAHRVLNGITTLEHEQATK